MINLKDKVALVTGGSRGIGRAVVLAFAREGADVIINYRADKKSAEETARMAVEQGSRAVICQADVSDRDQTFAMVDQAIKDFGRIDIVVNNAGLWEYNPIDTMTEENLKRTIDTNILGSFYPLMAAIPHMKKQRSGVIINISSTAGQRGEAFHSPYAASKGAVISLTKSLAVELADFNIRVNCVAPGWVETDMSRPSLQGDDAEKVTRQIPLGRVGRPEELAEPVLFLASDMATFITGEILNVNGGAVLCG
ncbi:MAG: glucose 1-dehydrogenase [FCB group bacterium]|nr:glucose 1-dehydrogenase [FCB group bacterium]